MKEFKYVITDPEGIHARPAGELVKAAKEFAANITLTKDGKSGDCKRIFGIMGLAVKAVKSSFIWRSGYFDVLVHTNPPLSS